MSGSVIAKLAMNNEPVSFGTGSFIHLQCVADNNMMAAYAGSEEDRLFSRYSPSGDLKLHQDGHWSVFYKPEPEHVEPVAPGTYLPPPAWYVIMIPVENFEGDDAPKFKGASAVVKSECHKKVKYGWDGQDVELRDLASWHKEAVELLAKDREYDKHRVVSKLSWKMRVDNPPAEASFVPGKQYWVTFWRAATVENPETYQGYTRDTALAAAFKG
jgi:hypothetical protein